MEKEKLILQLFKENKITIDEAIVLLSTDKYYYYPYYQTYPDNQDYSNFMVTYTNNV